MLKEPEKAAAKLDEFWARYSTAPDFIDKLLNIKNISWWNESYELHFAICERIAQAFPNDTQTIQVRADGKNRDSHLLIDNRINDGDGNR